MPEGRRPADSVLLRGAAAVFGVLGLLGSALADGQLLATGGVSTIEGSAGGGVVPWAVLAGYGTSDEWGGSAFASTLNTGDYRLDVAGGALTFNNRLELSLARQSLRLSTLGPALGLGAIRLEQLYDNPMREPLFLTTDTASDAIDMVLSGKAVAAMVPTPMVNGYRKLNTIQITESAPHLAFSAAKRVPLNVRVALRTALIGMNSDERGSEVLAALRLPGFELTDTETYTAFAGLLEHSRVRLRPNDRKVEVTDVALAPPAE